MAQKKKWIYSLTFCAFLLLIIFYSISMLSATKNITSERLQQAIDISSGNVARTLEYEMNDLLLTAKGGMPGSQSTTDIEVLLTNDYLANSDGVLHSAKGSLNGLSLDPAILHEADVTGYAVTSITDGLQQNHWIAVAPLKTTQKDYLVRSYPMNQLLELFFGEITLSTDYIFLFDRWGNPMGDYSRWGSPAADDVRQSVYNDAGAYGYSAQQGSLLVEKNHSFYNVYFEISNPKGWVIGARTDTSVYTSDLGNITLSVIFVFVSFILILTFVIGLDILNEKELKHKLKDANTTDLLTGLVNSFGVQDAVNRFMVKRGDESFHMVCLDVVAFSRFNSMFGFSVGDQLLKVIAEALRANYYSVSRVSADGFFCLAKGQDNSCVTLERELKQAISHNMGEEYLQVINFKFGSYPISQYKPENFRQIYEGALLALKSAKKNPVTSYVVYDEQLHKRGEMLRNIELNMIHALSKEEFVMYVQPQMDLPGETCSRGESLIRWESECMGFIEPDKFIPVFESNGFIVETDFFMLDAAMQYLQERIAQGKKLITIAVNQSKVTITFPNYYQRLQQLIEQYPEIPLKHIELEITESALENEWGTIVPLVHRIKKLGFSIAMDDFGSGFSSLNTLRILPIDILKIDREFLRESDQSDRSRIIIQHVIRMAKELNIKIVCEGVETQTHLQFLKDCGCDIAQGYFFSRPIPLHDFEERYCSN